MAASMQQNAAATSSTILVISSSRSRMEVIFCAHFCNFSRCSTWSSCTGRTETGSATTVCGLVAMGIPRPCMILEKEKMLQRIRCSGLGAGFCFGVGGNALGGNFFRASPFDLLQPLPNAFFDPFAGRSVIDAVDQIVG